MTDSVRTDIGDRVRAERKQRGLSQEALAYKVGLEQTDLSKIERGVQIPSADRARQIAAALGLDEQFFLGSE